MKFKHLLEQLQNLTEEQLENDVAIEVGPMEREVFSGAGYRAIVLEITASDHPVLDDNHPVIYIR